MKTYLQCHVEHENVTSKVADILEKYPQTRNNDKLLIYYILTDYYNCNHLYDIVSIKVPNFETIRRARQRLQAQGYYPSDHKTKESREQLEHFMQEISHFMR